MGWMWACLSFSVGTLEVFLCPIWNSFSCHVKPDAKMPAEFRCILVMPFGEEKLFVFFFMFLIENRILTEKIWRVLERTHVQCV